jgi:NADH-quinone oxidoreductase subunit K
MDIKAYIALSLTLFTIGIVGVLVRRNAIIIFMCIELMLNAVNLLLVGFSKMHALSPVAKASPNFASDAQIFVFFILTVAAAESAIGLAILVVLFRNLNTVNVEELDRLKG